MGALDPIQKTIAKALHPWNVEASGEKWAWHDSHRQAEAILAALEEAGFAIVACEAPQINA
jgi:hypothetical protein